MGIGHRATSSLDRADPRGFRIVGRYEFTSSHDWSLAGLIGLLYSTSYFPRSALGVHVEEFETDLATRLRTVEPSGVFRETISSVYDLAASSTRSEI